jgi:pimeloyl-ACP methyl ester carboxylesterase
VADDVAALLDHLGIAQADVVGFSMGGATAIQLAIRHPHLVRTLVPISAGFRSDAMQPELLATIRPSPPRGSSDRRSRPRTRPLHRSRTGSPTSS